MTTVGGTIIATSRSNTMSPILRWVEDGVNSTWINVAGLEGYVDEESIPYYPFPRLTTGEILTVLKKVSTQERRLIKLKADDAGLITFQDIAAMPLPHNIYREVQLVVDAKTDQIYCRGMASTNDEHGEDTRMYRLTPELQWVALSFATYDIKSAFWSGFWITVHDGKWYIPMNDNLQIWAEATGLGAYVALPNASQSLIIAGSHGVFVRSATSEPTGIVYYSLDLATSGTIPNSVFPFGMMGTAYQNASFKSFDDNYIIGSNPNFSNGTEVISKIDMAAKTCTTTTSPFVQSYSVSASIDGATIVLYDQSTGGAYATVQEGTQTLGILPVSSYDIISVIPIGVAAATSINVDGSAVISGGAVVAVVAADPTVVEVLYSGLPLPTGSVLRNTLTGQKFIKTTGNSLTYGAIPITPELSWGWLFGYEAWELLQDM